MIKEFKLTTISKIVTLLMVLIYELNIQEGRIQMIDFDLVKWSILFTSLANLLFYLHFKKYVVIYVYIVSMILYVPLIDLGFNQKDWNHINSLYICSNIVILLLEHFLDKKDNDYTTPIFDKNKEIDFLD